MLSQLFYQHCIVVQQVISRIMPSLNSVGKMESQGDDELRVLQLYEDETIPFRFYVTRSCLTLAEFKRLLVKHGKYKYVIQNQLDTAVHKLLFF